MWHVACGTLNARFIDTKPSAVSFGIRYLLFSSINQSQSTNQPTPLAQETQRDHQDLIAINYARVSHTAQLACIVVCIDRDAMCLQSVREIDRYVQINNCSIVLLR
jgi:hypothetical protein